MMNSLGIVTEKIEVALSRAQDALNLSALSHRTQFRTTKRLGKIGIGGFILGTLFGASLSTLTVSLLLVTTISHPPLYFYTLVSLLFLLSCDRV
jgi:hypothetical protein